MYIRQPPQFDVDPQAAIVSLANHIFVIKRIFAHVSWQQSFASTLPKP